MSQIASTAVVYPNVILGENVQIDDFCVIGVPALSSKSNVPLEIGSNSHIRSHSVIYQGARLGNNVITGHHVVIRANSVLDSGSSLGSYSSVDEDVSIGAYTRIHGYTQIGKGTVIGSFCWIYSLVTLMNDPLPPSFIFRPVTIGDMVTIAVGAQILPDVELGSGSFISSSSLVKDNVPSACVVSGNPAEVVGKVKHMIHLDSAVSHPWTSHFLDFYPSEEHEKIKMMSKSIYGM